MSLLISICPTNFQFLQFKINKKNLLVDFLLKLPLFLNIFLCHKHTQCKINDINLTFKINECLSLKDYLLLISRCFYFLFTLFTFFPLTILLLMSSINLTLPIIISFEVSLTYFVEKYSHFIFQKRCFLLSSLTRCLFTFDNNTKQKTI